MDPATTATMPADLQLVKEPINMDTIASLRDLDDGGGELLGELIGLFLGDTPPRLSAIRAAVEKRDPAELVRAAHALKSSAANLGATNMATLCQRLESQGRRGSTDGAEPLVGRLEEEFQVVQAVLNRQLPS